MDRVPFRGVTENFEQAVTIDSVDRGRAIESFLKAMRNAAPIGRDILELGTATSLFAISLCQEYTDIRIMAADWDVQLLELARYRLESASLTQRIQLQWVETNRLIFQDEYFDTVYSLQRCHEWSDPRAFVGEMYRVLRKGGLLWIRDWLRPSTPEQLEHLLVEWAAREPVSLQEASSDMHRAAFSAAWNEDEIRSMVDPMGLGGEWDFGEFQWTYCIRKP